ncbi:SNF2 family N-terminal domain-containing protein [Irpex lacteus]|nr:SNF2 family N-terminal domain-containing protein [Irpex lacteus]
MPAFQAPFISVSAKRRLDHDSSNLPPSKRQSVEVHGPRSYWMVQWRAPQQKKHKTWDGDGVLLVKGSFFDLLDVEDGRRIACGKPTGIDPSHLGEGSEFSLAGKDLQIDHPVKEADYMAGTCFANGAVAVNTSAEASSRGGSSSVLKSSSSAVKQFTPLKPRNSNGMSYKVPSFTRPGASSTTATTITTTTATRPTVTDADVSGGGKEKDTFWMVNWRKPQQRKHKTWDGDAYLTHHANTLTLVSEKGIVMGKKRLDVNTTIEEGFSTTIGNKEVEIDRRISKSSMPAISGSSEYENDGDLVGSQVSHGMGMGMGKEKGSFFGTVATAKGSFSGTAATPKASLSGTAVASPSVVPKKTGAASASSFYAHAPVKAKAKGPLHDPLAEGAIVMPAPNADHIARYNKKCVSLPSHLPVFFSSVSPSSSSSSLLRDEETQNAPVVPVVIDPVLARRLREHQVEGVKFMYECVMAMKGHDGRGCILADEMGMGKTLQTITLVWTLLKQNPYAGIGPVVGKVLIVCPVTLINNWKNEFHKWLGRDRVGVFVGDKDKALIKQFVNSRIHHVLIIGYERLRSVIQDLQYCIPPIGLIICDEGHRLKSANNKTSAMFEALSTTRRIILSGTPIQNDLGEFHAMADFCNPGLLGNDKSFKKIYEVPILKSRAPDCTAKDKELGEARLEQLLEVANSFVLRREATILKKFLPPKHEYVVFIAPTKLQRDIFHKILTAEKLDSLVRNSTADSLALISMLTKISNSPILLKAALDQANERGGEGGIVRSSVVADAVQFLPGRAQVDDVSLSGKLAALANLLRAIYKTTDEKCIIVSHYTSTLSIIEAFCKKKNYSYHRLDGSTPGPKRQEYVNDFNKIVFLLSSKAGGVGLNLIGASRLCLVDSDWNPSHDLQSMGRIHRDGQKRPVFIYRFLTAGSIDEKIYQRQITKLGLSDSLLGKGGSDSKSDSFTRKDLRDIFTVHPDTACHTHDLLECPCPTGSSGLSSRDKVGDDSTNDIGTASDERSGGEDDEKEMGFISASAMDPAQFDKMDQEYLRQKKAQLAALGKWKHINCLRRKARDQISDPILQKLVYVPPDEEDDDEEEDEDAGGSKGGLSSLLDAVDLGRVLKETRPALAVDKVPGGSVSFLFERTSETTIEEGEQDE